MPNATNCGAIPVLALELDRNGNVSKKTMKLDREAQLTNSLLQGLYPGIRVATVDVPDGAVGFLRAGHGRAGAHQDRD